MQCTVRLLEVPAQTVGGVACAQKVAVKLPAKDAAAMDDDAGAFADIMAALMNLTSDPLNPSMGHFAWVTVDGGAKEWMPLIDLTHLEGKGNNTIQMLLNTANTANEGQTQPASLFQLKLKQWSASNPGHGQSAEANDNIGELAGDVLTNPPIEPSGQNSAEKTKDTIWVNKDGQLSAARLGKTEISFPQQKMPGDPTDSGALGTKGPIEPKSSDADLHKQNKRLDLSMEKLQADAPKMVLQDQTVGTSRSDEVVKAAQALGPKVIVQNKRIDNSQSPNAGAAGHDSGKGAAFTKENAHLKEVFGDASDKPHPAPKVDGENSASASPDKSAGNTNGVPPSIHSSNQGMQTGDAQWKNIDSKTLTQVQTEADIPADSKDLQSDVIRQIVQRMSLRTDGRQSHMQIKLKPEFLGNLRMEVITDNQQVVIRMAAENHKVKEMIEQNIHVLKSELQQHGLQIQKFDVLVSQSNDPWKNGQQQTAFRQSHERGGRNGHHRRGNNGKAQEIDVGIIGDPASNTHSRSGEVDFFA